MSIKSIGARFRAFLIREDERNRDETAPTAHTVADPHL